MGKMIEDAKSGAEAMCNFNFIDMSKIFVAGYFLGATVGLLAASLDIRITRAVSVAGFTPMRLNKLERGTDGTITYSHMH